MENTRKLLKKSTVKSNKHDDHGFGQYDCVSDLAHKIICKHNLTASNENVRIINRIPLCEQCYKAIQLVYDSAVNGGFEYSMEVYLDTYVEKQVEIIAKASCVHQDYISGYELIDSSITILADLKASLQEKVYSRPLTTTVQCHEYLHKQGCIIKRSDDQIGIKFSPDREFTLPDEMMAIHAIAKDRDAQETINFNKREVVIKKVAN